MPVASSVARAAINVVQPAADAKGITLDYYAEPGLGAISADSARVHQIIWNLLSNAVKFTPHGGNISLRVEQDETNARVMVKDSGQGIDSEFLPTCHGRDGLNWSSAAGKTRIPNGVGDTSTCVRLAIGRILTNSRGMESLRSSSAPAAHDFNGVRRSYRYSTRYAAQ